MLAVLAGRLDSALPSPLRAAVVNAAGQWAVDTAAPGRAFVSDRLPDARVAGTTVFYEPDPDAVPAAIATLLAEGDGPVLLVAPDVPGVDGALGAAALRDLAQGCSLTFAPAFDGVPFLLGVPSPSSPALALLGSPNRPRDEVFAAAMALGGEVGMLRSERRLVSPADARALAADPRAPVALRDALRTRSCGAGI